MQTSKYRPYRLGTHTKALMVSQFPRKPTAQATINAVARVMPHLPKDDVLALAAHVWYQRSNHRASAYTFHFGMVGYLYYKEYGVWPVSPTALATIKPSTLAGVKKLLGI